MRKQYGSLSDFFFIVWTVLSRVRLEGPNHSRNGHCFGGGRFKPPNVNLGFLLGCAFGEGSCNLGCCEDGVGKFNLGLEDGAGRFNLGRVFGAFSVAAGWLGG